MNFSPVWLSASLACLLALVLLACAACLVLIRRVNRLSRFEQRAEQRLIQLALELRRLERGGRDSKGPRRDPGKSDAPPSLISVPNMATPTAPEPDDAAGLVQKHAELWAMAERGLGAAEIARATGRPIGQVELILGLRRSHNAIGSAGDHANTT